MLTSHNFCFFIPLVLFLKASEFCYLIRFKIIIQIIIMAALLPSSFSLFYRFVVTATHDEGTII